SHNGSAMAGMRPIPFALVAPAAIVLFGAAVTLASTFLGLRELSSLSEQAAQFQSKTLARSFGARLSELGVQDRQQALMRAAETCSCIFMILDQQRSVLHAAPLQPLSQSDLQEISWNGGNVTIAQQNYHYFAQQLAEDNTRLVAFAGVVDITSARNQLISSMVTFAALLLAAAGFVGWALARDVHSDVLYVRDQIVSMAEDRASKKTRTVPVRTIDQVGE